MDDLTQQLLGQLANGGLSQISQKVGADESATSSALSVAMPLLVSALANNAAKPDGAQSLHQALNNDHHETILNDLPGFLNNPQAANGAGILGHVLGGQQSAITQGLSQGTGLDANQIDTLLQVAAPLVMGALGQQQQQQGLDSGGLSSFLGGQQQAAQASNPGLMGTLNRLLDFDGDGSAIDDIIGMVGKFFR